jgi:NADH dehydrogenase
MVCEGTRAIMFQVGFKNRLTTLLHWAVTFVGRGRSERTVTQQQIFARQALDQHGDQFSPTLSPHPEQDPQS